MTVFIKNIRVKILFYFQVFNASRKMILGIVIINTALLALQHFKTIAFLFKKNYCV